MKKSIKYLAISVIVFFGGGLPSCTYLDVVPDNVATIDNAFSIRAQAQKYLFTCYSYLPNLAEMTTNPALVSGDEIWFYYPYLTNTSWGPVPTNWEIARGNQNVNSPMLNYWDGNNGGKPLFQGIRDCNTFLENIHKVPDMDDYEKDIWISEVLFLKAYYHWFLFRMYGPIPIMDQNYPMSASPEEVKAYRQPVDSVVNYMVRLLDQAAENLPETLFSPAEEMGRITKPIALATKARILMSAASPLFNGNTDYADFVDNRGVHLFNTTVDPSKWQRAAQACKEAIELCESLAYKLYEFTPPVGAGVEIGPELQVQMSIRSAVTEKWNSEIIWALNKSMVSKTQLQSIPWLIPSGEPNVNTGPQGQYAPPLKIAEQFYTKNGLPIQMDKTWDYAARNTIVRATDEDRLYVQPGYETVALHFDREPRFYASIGFDGGKWWGHGWYNENSMLHAENRAGRFSGKSREQNYSITGYYNKKLVHYLSAITPSNANLAIQPYPWPVMRLADLYLYYAEALNEVHGPTAESQFWINLVRERAGIPTVQESWENYSSDPSRYQTKEGFREIIHQERLIEMVFEGNRFWDLRRWKKASEQMNGPITGWDITQPEPAGYYTPKLLFSQTYPNAYYFWPIAESAMIRNSNLVQNPGW